MSDDAYAEEEARPGWRIDSIESADWALRRLGEFHREMAQLDDMRAAAIARIEVQHQRAAAGIQKGMAFFRSQLEVYATEHRGELLTGKRKSRQLLSGSIGWRTRPARLEVTDGDALLTWAGLQADKSFVRIKASPAMDAIQAWHKKSGEIPPGTDLIEGREELVIKSDDGGNDDRADEF